ncbi:helix-turn-helix domain-containing protein [Micromonospora sp. SL4-19]|uniref:helix-turn-helix domain-containing protein n=1 Tax=Micromonospora sp. SL4-19 TaxID=3399129 RepID=UPI003A4D237D
MSESRLARQIATAVRHERERRQLTQLALADLAGLSQGGVARIERGEDRVSRLSAPSRWWAGRRRPGPCSPR